MLLEAVKTVTTLVQRRFLLNALLPSLILWIALLIVFWSGLGGLSAAVGFWNSQSQVLKIIEGVGFVAWIWLFAGLIASQWSALVALYSGRWPLPTRVRNFLGVNWHRKRLHKLLMTIAPSQGETVGDKVPSSEGVKEAENKLYYCYPEVDDPVYVQLAPTTLGNIQRSAEVYVLNRYEAEWDSAWPRLYPLLPGQFLRTLEERRAGLELTLVASAAGGCFGIVAGSYLLLVHSSWWIFLSCFWGGLLLAAVMQALSTDRAQNYTQTLRMAFDLYRHELRKQMCLTPPTDLAAERKQWTAFSDFLRLGANEMPFSYPDSSPEELGNEERWALSFRKTINAEKQK